MLDITFYGVRGSTPCSCDATRGVGGNTSCVLVRGHAGSDPLILDCGTGLRYLGRDLMAEFDDRPFKGVALLTHLHWDHLQGLPFFLPILSDGAELTVVGPEQPGSELGDEIGSFIRPPLFPVGLDELPGSIIFRAQCRGTLTFGTSTVTVQEVAHVGATNGYRIDDGGGSVAYLSDHQQPSDGSLDVPESVVELCRDVDVLIHDAQYDAEEFAGKSTWGHSTPDYAAEVALRSGARRLVLFHHDPSHDDAWIRRVTAELQQRVGDRLEVLAASEGLSLRSGT
jgi:phosphoribosyl 1,2-cyclic phosphodiesterase